MSVWARDEQRRLVRVIPQRHPKDSTVRRLFKITLIFKWNTLEINKLILIQMTAGYLVTSKDPMSPHDKKMLLHCWQPWRLEGEILIFSKTNIELPLPLYRMWKGPFERFCNLKEPQQTHVFAYLKRLTNSL